MDDLSDIRELYNGGWDVEDTRLTRHQLEGDLTWRYLDRHLPSAGKLLEIGFGTGFYTFPLAQRGYEITAVDLAPQSVARCRAKAEELGLADRIDFREGDARLLGGIPSDAFDAVLMMGPLYHLVLAADREAALRAAHARLKPGGVLFTALLSRLGVLGNLIRDKPEWIDHHAAVQSHIRHGHRPADAPKGGFRGYWVHLDEIAPMHEAEGFRTIAIAGVEPAISADDESYNALTGERRDRWLDLLFDISADPSMVASSRHLLYIGQKRAEDAG